MTDDQKDPTTHRLIQTRDGVAAVPREQKGVPLTEYFRNADLPEDLNRSVVFATTDGPVLARPDPVAWNQEHAIKADEFAQRLKAQIDEKGYYARTLGLYAGRLADETGQQLEQMKAVIVDSFQRENGKDPFTYLKDLRQEQGLPTGKEQDPVHDHPQTQME